MSAVPDVADCLRQQLPQLRVEGSAHVTRRHAEAREQRPQQHGPGLVRLAQDSIKATTQEHVNACLPAYMCMYVCCVCMSVYVCMYVCMFLCLFECVHVCTDVCTYL